MRALIARFNSLELPELSKDELPEGVGSGLRLELLQRFEEGIVEVREDRVIDCREQVMQNMVAKVGQCEESIPAHLLAVNDRVDRVESKIEAFPRLRQMNRGSNFRQCQTLTSRRLLRARYRDDGVQRSGR